MKYILSFTLICLSLVASAQKETPASGCNASQNYVEIGGPGIFYSINYDGRFGKTEKGLGFRAGAGILASGGESFTTFPVGLNYLIGSEGKYFEVGAGASFLNYNSSFDWFDGGASTGYLQLGYRNQPTKQGFTWRANFTPLFGSGYFVPFASVSLGYKF